MRRIGGWRIVVALLLGLGTVLPVLAADPSDDEEAARQGWHWAPWIQKKIDRSKPPPKPKKPAAKPPKEPEKKAAAPSKPAPVVDEGSVEREREEKAFLRRVAVCDQLMKIAQEAHDQQLERKAQQLNERAWALYSERIAQLPASGAYDPDVQVFERQFNAGTDGRPAGADLYQTSAGDRGSRAAVREVKP